MRKNQRQKILDYIQRWGSITTYQAYIDLGITQLATRISELKKEGYEFETNWKTRKNRDGQVICFKEYIIKNNKWKTHFLIGGRR